MDAKENKECLKDLRQTDPRDDKTRIEQTKGGLLRDSYCWILDHADFQRWRDDPTCQLLWIKGDAGKGKTMLLCGIIDEMEKLAAYRLTYFFCQATEAALRGATGVLRGLIYLLIVQQPCLISYVREKYDHAGKQLFEDRNAWPALSGMLTAILNDPGLDNAVLIIDALDECVDELPRLLNFIAEVSSLCRARWIVSSRNWPSIEEKLGNTTQNVRLSLELNESSISTAVQTYIRYKVRLLAQQKRYDSATRDAVEQHLVSSANGTFLWVALVCQELADSKVRKRHTLAKLKSFPPGLDSLYQRMLEHICNSIDADLCKQILAVVSVSYRPITLIELRYLVEPLGTCDDNDVEETIGSCGSLLTLRQGVIYLVHQSVKEFLVTKQFDKIFPCGIEGVHRSVSFRSLKVMSETLRRDIYGLHNPCLHIQGIRAPNPDPLAAVAYSCVYWADHIYNSSSDSKAMQEDVLQDGGAIHTFFKEKYIYWLEALSLLGSISKGVVAIQKLDSLLVGLNSLTASE
ncbi:NACHT domain-containing protein [Dactylonectria macrodidyma]|uniref:NACHT domain-containing protein n=1 Tax=Dactylonectria macrodidyma TaxID=307937 RepID=A0A9P9DQ94_9HYPO|nr:NACHT domain-containing protein [Dactylonectria macrodidyma]